MISVHPERARPAALLALLLATAVLAGCGGGDPETRITNISAGNVRYGQTLTVAVNGSGLDAPGLSLEVVGPACSDRKRASASDAAASFTCRIEGTGPLAAVIRNADGGELARVTGLAVAQPQVRMTVAQGTRSGSFVIELDPQAAPITALNFVRYVGAGFYANTIFHRVLPAQIAQGGQYLTDKSQRKALYDPIALESNNGLKNLRGTIAMARTVVPNSATAQFYFNLRDNPAFDYQDVGAPGYAVFGRVISGMEVVDEIGKVPVYTYDNSLPSVPQQDVTITLALQTQ